MSLPQKKYEATSDTSDTQEQDKTEEDIDKTDKIDRETICGTYTLSHCHIIRSAHRHISIIPESSNHHQIIIKSPSNHHIFSVTPFDFNEPCHQGTYRHPENTLNPPERPAPTTLPHTQNTNLHESSHAIPLANSTSQSPPATTFITASRQKDS